MLFLYNKIHQPVMRDRLVYDDWLIANAETFWSEIAHSHHVLQVYDNDGVFIDAVTGFVQAALNANETAVVTATEAHLNALETRLQAYGLDIEMLISQHRFIPINVEEISRSSSMSTIFLSVIASLSEKPA